MQRVNAAVVLKFISSKIESLNACLNRKVFTKLYHNHNPIYKACNFVEIRATI